MPTYRVTDPQTGKTLRLTGDSPPSEDELIKIFDQYSGSQPTQTAMPTPAPEVPSVDNRRTASGSRVSDIGKTPGAINLAKFLGIEKAGKRLGSELVKLTPEGKELKKNKESGKISEDEYRSITTGDVSNKQVAGSAINLAGLLATFGLGAGATVGTRAAQGAGFGATQGVGTSLENNGSAQDAAKAAVTGATIGAALPVVAEKGAKVLQDRAAQKAARLYDSVLGISKQEVKNAVSNKAKTTGQKLVEKGGLPGFGKTKQGVFDVASQRVDDLEKEIQPLIKQADQSGSVINTQVVIAPLQKIKQELVELGEPIPARLDSVIKAISNKGETITPSEANKLKRDYYSLLRGKKANFNVPREELDGAKQIWRAAATGLREEIEKAVPTIRELNQEQGLHLQVSDKVLDAIAKGELRSVQDVTKLLGSLLNTGNVIRRGTAAAAGSFLGPVGAIGLPLVGEAANTTPAATARAKISTKIANSKLSPEANKIIERLLTSASAKQAEKL